MSPGAQSQVVIYYTRIGKPPARYVEGLVEDDGRRVKTATDVSNVADFRPAWIAPGERVALVRKYLFYDEHFAVMELRTADERLLGYYCDVGTPALADLAASITRLLGNALPGRCRTSSSAGIGVADR